MTSDELALQAAAAVALHAGSVFWETVGSEPLRIVRDVATGQDAELQA